MLQWGSNPESTVEDIQDEHLQKFEQWGRKGTLGNQSHTKAVKEGKYFRIMVNPCIIHDNDAEGVLGIQYTSATAQ